MRNGPGGKQGGPMRLAIVADIHGNYRALQAVLADVSVTGADRIVPSRGPSCSRSSPSARSCSCRPIASSARSSSSNRWTASTTFVS